MAPDDDARSAALKSRESDFNSGQRTVKQTTISFLTATDDDSLSAVLRSALKFKCINPSAIFYLWDFYRITCMVRIVAEKII